ncbi:hypothetical protein L195_g063669, partial [Trifolium pratense]
ALVEETRFEVEVHQSGMAMEILRESKGDQTRQANLQEYGKLQSGV